MILSQKADRKFQFQPFSPIKSQTLLIHRLYGLWLIAQVCWCSFNGRVVVCTRLDVVITPSYGCRGKSLLTESRPTCRVDILGLVHYDMYSSTSNFQCRPNPWIIFPQSLIFCLFFGWIREMYYLTYLWLNWPICILTMKTNQLILSDCWDCLVFSACFRFKSFLLRYNTKFYKWWPLAMLIFHCSILSGLLLPIVNRKW